MNELMATVEIQLIMREGESERAASNRLYDLLWAACNSGDTNADFWIWEEWVN